MSPTTFLADVADQPDVLRHHADQRVATGEFERYGRIIIAGMGASLSASYPLWIELTARGLPAWHLNAAQLLEQAEGLIASDTLLVLVSQSGRSAEMLALIEHPAMGRADLLVVTNDSDSPLAKAAQLVVELRAGPESGVSTKTYAATVAALYILGAPDVESATRRLGAIARAADLLEYWLAGFTERLLEMTNEVTRSGTVFLVGRRTAYATATYGALAIKEAARVPVEGMTAAQFRHGPMEVVDSNATVIICSNDDSPSELDLRISRDIQACGARVAWVYAGVESRGITCLPVLAATEPFARTLGGIASVQLLTAAMSASHGCTPGEMRNTAKVTTVL